MKIFRTTQIRKLDQFTIEHEPIVSIDLMERAAKAIFTEFIISFPTTFPVCILAGSGNNGGDALALARLLLEKAYKVDVILLHSGKITVDCEANKSKLQALFPKQLTIQHNTFVAPDISEQTILIDGLFGSGLSREIEGFYADAINWMNASGCHIISIDIPSGLQGEENSSNSSVIVKANLTYSIQFPKLAFLFPENEKYVGKWKLIDIGILPQIIATTESMFAYLDKSDIQLRIRPRSKFAHKGSFGHILLIAGSEGMAGAAILSAKAAMRSGAGLVTVQSVETNRIILQTALPEAIFHSHDYSYTATEKTDYLQYTTIAIGPGIGQEKTTVSFLKTWLINQSNPLIIDADALNIISKNPDFLNYIPHKSILTPHPKEFERLFGTCENGYMRMKKANEMSVKLGIIIILKGANTLIALPDGQLFFNSTGNSGMATAGAGDVLTGIISGLLAQGYLPEEAAIVGVYLHGLAADLALTEQSEESLMAGDIIDCLGRAFKEIASHSAK